MNVVLNASEAENLTKGPSKLTFTMCMCVLTFLSILAKSFSTHVMSYFFWRKNCTVSGRISFYIRPASWQDSSFLSLWHTRTCVGRMTTIASSLISYFPPNKIQRWLKLFRHVWPFPVFTAGFYQKLRLCSFLNLCLFSLLAGTSFWVTSQTMETAQNLHSAINGLRCIVRISKLVPVSSCGFIYRSSPEMTVQ